MMRNNSRYEFLATAALAATIVGLAAAQVQAQLLVYEPFNYTTGENLGGFDADGAGPNSGDPNDGRTGNYAAGGGGGAYKWRSHGVVSNYQSPNDAVISSGSLSYAGLATSQGNSVSYGSNVDNSALYLDAIPLPGPITSGSLYASFIMRVKSNVSSNFRHSPVAFVFETTGDGNAGSALGPQSGSPIATPGSFWMRTDPLVTGETNFSPGKTNSDGIGPGAPGPSAGYQHSNTVSFTESNQFGDLNGQLAPDFNNSSTYQTYFVVLKYEFDAMATTNGQNDTVSLWMNPGSGTLGTATGEIDASQNPTMDNKGSYYAAIDAFGTTTPDSAAINTFALFGHRQNVLSTIAVDLDELRIGRTWADVTPTAAAGQPGDFNGDGFVDAADYVAFRKTGGNYNDFYENFGEPAPGSGGAVPEPSTFAMLALCVSCLSIARRANR